MSRRMRDIMAEYMSEGMPGRIMSRRMQDRTAEYIYIDIYIYIHMFISDRMSVGGDHSKKTFFFRG